MLSAMREFIFFMSGSFRCSESECRYELFTEWRSIDGSSSVFTSGPPRFFWPSSICEVCTLFAFFE